jgi:hypothetical protein
MHEQVAGVSVDLGILHTAALSSSVKDLAASFCLFPPSVPAPMVCLFLGNQIWWWF